MATGPGAPKDGPQTTDDEAEPLQGELFTAHELMTLERERLASADKRTEVVRAAIQASSEADERQYQYQMARLNKDDDHRKETRAIAKTVLYGGLGVFSIVTIACLAFAFLGDAQQSETAMTFLKTMMTGAGGAGIWIVLRQIFIFLTGKG